MHSPDDIQQQFILLQAHRQTLANYLVQKAQQGQAFTIPAVLNGIIESRQHIAHIKQYLRSKNIKVEDFNIDEEHLFTSKVDELKSMAFHTYRDTPVVIPSVYQPIIGRWNFTDRSIRYLGPEDEYTRIPHGIILIKNMFTDGVIDVTVSFTKIDPNACARILFGYDRTSLDYYTVGIGGYSRAFVLSKYVSKTAWLCTDFYGLCESLELSEYRLRLEVKETDFIAIINGIEMFKGKLPDLKQDSRFGFFAWGVDPIEFKDISLSRK